MRSRGPDLIPVVQGSYDLCAGLFEHVDRFPRAQRTLLGRVLLDDALRMLVPLMVANRRRDKRASLAHASGRLDALRIVLRLSHRLGYLSHGGYQHMAETADEVGRMLGGWLKHESAAADAKTAPEPSAVSSPKRVRVAPAAGTAARRTGGVRYTMTSPTIARYLQARLAHPDAVVFVRVGVFLVTFFEDAAFCGRHAGLAVHDRAADSEPEKILACGFPHGALEKYVALLRQAGRVVHVE